MNFQRKLGTKYNHYLCEDRVILGVSKELDVTEVELLCKNPMQFENVVGEIMTSNINPVQRANILDG